MKESDRWGHEYRRHTQSVLQVDEKGVTEQWKRNGCLMKGTEVKWLASWGSHITFSAQTVHTGQQGRASGYGLGHPSPGWARLEAPRQPSSSTPKRPPTPSFHTASPFAFAALSPESLISFPPVLGPALCSRSLQSDLPFPLRFPKQQPHWLTLSSIWPVLFFRTSLPGIVHIFRFVCLLPPEHKLQERGDSQIWLTFGSPVTTTAETRHVLHKRATDTLAEDRIGYAPATA